MSILSVLRERLSGDHASARAQSAPNAPTEGGPAAEAGLPFAGYDRLDDRHVIDALSDHSQLELEAVENYERAHKSRERVLDKLRYMRGSEPFPGYDALSAAEVVVALNGADLATVKRVRVYERKFANRRDVVTELGRAFQQVQVRQTAGAASAYQPVGEPK